MKNTLENKEKFFGLYRGQSIQNYKLSRHSAWKKNVEVKDFTFGHLELKTISSLTTLEKLDIAKFYESTASNIFVYDNQLNFMYLYGDETQSVAVDLNTGYCLDYLRSKGFATEWLGLSIEKQIDYGWIKLV